MTDRQTEKLYDRLLFNQTVRQRDMARYLQQRAVRQTEAGGQESAGEND